MDWKKVSNATASSSSVPITKKRLPKKIRQVPDYYFLPRRSLPSAFAFYGACCAAGVGAGMILEVWIKKKIKGVDRPFKVAPEASSDLIAPLRALPISKYSQEVMV
ncbi:hypothetical protein ZIOFF_004103 [Zingiber officinale]|uniref:Uncharacterized protein n=1 Tax=Zingiber officinale TaxID=94328 RepID=A0A8J5M082_ZINOF|nr:hypothetical protein ZIOFF_004103 [Zingiber officinale]